MKRDIDCIFNGYTGESVNYLVECGNEVFVATIDSVIDHKQTSYTPTCKYSKKIEVANKVANPKSKRLWRMFFTPLCKLKHKEMKEERETIEPTEVESTEVVDPATIASVESATAVESTPGGRELLVERMRGYNPDGAYDTDDDLYTGIGQLLDERDGMVASSEKLAKIFKENPQTASFFIDMTEGKGLYESLARNFGDDLLSIINGDETAAAELDAGLAEWRKQAGEREAREAEMQSNLDKFREEYRAWAEEQGYSDEELAEMEDEMIRIADAMSRGNHLDFVKAMHRSRRYDADIESARAEGEIRGRNAHIAEERSMPRRGGDGLPSMQNMARPDEPVRPTSKWSEKEFWGE